MATSGGRDRQQGNRRNANASDRGPVQLHRAAPRTDWLPDEIERDTKGFVQTGPALANSDHWKLGSTPFLLETSKAGVFAAGDVRSGSVKRVASAVGEGSMAIQFAPRILEVDVMAIGLTPFSHRNESVPEWKAGERPRPAGTRWPRSGPDYYLVWAHPCGGNEPFPPQFAEPGICDL